MKSQPRKKFERCATTDSQPPALGGLCLLSLRPVKLTLGRSIPCWCRLSCRTTAAAGYIPVHTGEHARGDKTRDNFRGSRRGMSITCTAYRCAMLYPPKACRALISSGPRRRPDIVLVISASSPVSQGVSFRPSLLRSRKNKNSQCCVLCSSCIYRVLYSLAWDVLQIQNIIAAIFVVAEKMEAKFPLLISSEVSCYW